MKSLGISSKSFSVESRTSIGVNTSGFVNGSVSSLGFAVPS